MEKPLYIEGAKYYDHPVCFIDEQVCINLISHCLVLLIVHGLDGIPSDGTPIVVLNTFYMPIYIIYDVFVILGIIFAFVCLLFNIIFRNRK